MAFDQTTRNRLARFVSDTRSLLTEEFTRQLQNDYGLDPKTGEVTDLARLSHLDDARRETARLLRDTMDHYLASADIATLAKAKKARQDVIDRIVREQAFTVLNRLCALRMAEARGLLIESIGQGYQSKGFQLYQHLTNAALGETGAAYRIFLFSVFDEFAVDLAVLFDRFSPKGRLFPRETALLDVLAQINLDEIAALWSEDETIGWLYQYFNSDTERKKMREESSAPRNSRELAVRNQFFTPRYVVEFLTDNTLGRIWYEMTRGETVLRNQCRYLVRRPTEIFLKPGESAPESAAGIEAEGGENLSQEDLLRQPVHIPHRPLKDPREIRLLDPACGSMHFGLYAFDLFNVIYDEAWEIAHSPDDAVKAAETFAPFVTFVATFSDKAAFLREVPKLIIERNLHGIDIDPRAAQIAGLSLWLRAQRAWHQAGVKLADRPRITRSNLVCAEPMPGEKELLREFVEQQFPVGERPAFAFLLETIFDRMTLAGEAGSLLRIEEEIRTAIADAKRLWKQSPKAEQVSLFATSSEKVVQGELRLDLSGITDEQFWERAEQRIYDALEAYAEQTENGGGLQRRLFANDAAQGFAFIDVCRKRYDVVVMNPPFGRRSEPSSSYFDLHYGSFKSDIGLAFVDSFSQRLVKGGQLGALTSRTFLAGGSFDEWRKDVLLSSRPVRVLLDLGIGVLDDALVETCAYVLQHQPSEYGWFLRALEATDKGGSVDAFFSQRGNGQGIRAFLTPLETMRVLPMSIMAYWLPPDVSVTIKETGTLDSIQAATKHGVQTTDDFQFMRLAWEVPLGSVSSRGRWPVLAKGGEYAPYFDNLHLCVDWMSEGTRLKAYLAAKRMETQGSPDWTPWMNSHEDYFCPGLTFPARTASDFCPRILPAGCVFTASGQALLFVNHEQAYGYLAGAFSRAFKIIVDAFVCSGDNSVSGSAANTYRTGLVNALPLPTDVNSRDAQELGEKCVRLAYQVAAAEETSLNFHLAAGRRLSLKSYAAAIVATDFRIALELLELSERADRAAQSFFGFSDELLAHLHGPLPTSYPNAKVKLDRAVMLLADEKLVAEALKRHGPRRQLTKKTYIANRRLELLCHIFGVHPERIIMEFGAMDLWSELHLSAAEDELSVALGSAFGRWDIRYATGERPAPELPDPFEPLPTCPPGMLQGDDGLPLSTEAGRLLWAEGRYPLEVPWDGILVDDPEHPLDLERRVHAALTVLWHDRADALENEACALLGVPTLRGWFRRPAGFFADHLRRYSKSRRQAPIYWPLSTRSGSYTLWLYYHRLTDQTLYTCVIDFLEPKLKQVVDDAARLRTKTVRSSFEEKDLERLSNLELELKDFRDELLRIARFWKPNLNDGVQITAAPLWQLFRLPKWQKTLKETWEKLEAGEYDWAHLALSVWPDRVVRASHKDRSYAIAHDLDERLWHETEVEKKSKGGKVKKVKEWQPRDLTEAELKTIIAEVQTR
ncbi:MAG: BREX-1 system adenine-specific DNA-methyltransferase PglX [Bacteroidota bacterium]